MKPFRYRILITGATGYIGTYLVKRLINLGSDVHIVSRALSKLEKLDSYKDVITIHEHDGSAQDLEEIIKRAKPYLVYHLASLFLGQHQTADVDSLVGSNVLFSTQLVEAMHKNDVKYLINTGTSWQHFQDELYNPVNLYAATKQAFEDILKYYIETSELKVITLSLFDTYGPADTRSKLMPLLWKCAIEQEPLLMSAGEQLIDIVYIEDVINAFIRAAELVQDQSLGHLTFGVSSGNPIKLTNLVSIFEEIIEVTLPITWGGRPYRKREVMVPWESYVHIPGWKPLTTLKTGILESKPKNKTEG